MDAVFWGVAGAVIGGLAMLLYLARPARPPVKTRPRSVERRAWLLTALPHAAMPLHDYLDSATGWQIARLVIVGREVRGLMETVGSDARAVLFGELRASRYALPLMAEACLVTMPEADFIKTLEAIEGL